MLYSWMYAKPTIYGYALLWELVDDINDMVCMSFLWWPFHERDIKMTFVMGFHHLCGVIIIIPALTTGLYMDNNFQCVGLALLLAGGVSCSVLVISRTMDRRIGAEAWMDFYLWIGNLLFFFLCRFYVFPQQLFIFFNKPDWQVLLQSNMSYCIYASVACMIIFNVLILMDATQCTLTRLRIAINKGENHLYNPTSRCGTCLGQKNEGQRFKGKSCGDQGVILKQKNIRKED